jgi:anti-sigma regulatory factor (Ser/Thr protein kinase)
MDFDIAAPHAALLVESLHAFGYELPTAPTDLFENSITAGTKNVWLDFHWDGENSAIVVIDSGAGKSEEKLLAAMRPGSQIPLMCWGCPGGREKGRT